MQMSYWESRLNKKKSASLEWGGCEIIWGLVHHVYDFSARFVNKYARKGGNLFLNEIISTFNMFSEFSIYWETLMEKMSQLGGQEKQGKETILIVWSSIQMARSTIFILWKMKEKS